MNNIIKVGEAINASEYMTSMEVAEITGKEHKHVMRDIRVLLEQGVHESNFGLTFIIRTLPNNAQRKDPCYNITKKGCLILASGYNALLREKIIDRWEELETKERQNVPALPQTYLEALKALVLSEEQKQVLALENESMKPKADYFDTLVERGSNLNLRDTAKMIGVSERFFIEYLLLNGYLYRDAKRKLKPIAKYVGRYFVLKEWVRGENTGSQTLVTVEGKDKFYKLINK
ncbi:hypothetical protein BF698P3_00058 [Bacteroides phage BF698P3]|nr:hypothetical protein BF698P3_00058 [Bacteroides phage BF698P3]